MHVVRHCFRQCIFPVAGKIENLEAFEAVLVENDTSAIAKEIVDGSFKKFNRNSVDMYSMERDKERRKYRDAKYNRKNESRAKHNNFSDDGM
jgi:hypothetical protein